MVWEGQPARLVVAEQAADLAAAGIPGLGGWTCVTGCAGAREGPDRLGGDVEAAVAAAAA
jgi:hypothetical protein